MAESSGTFAHIGESCSAAAQYLGAKARLAGIETREALAHYALIVALVVGALVALAFGYMFLLVSAVFLIGHYSGIHWGWLLLGAATLHFVGVAVCLVMAKSRFAQPMFQTTLAELKKDQEWLRRPTTKTI